MPTSQICVDASKEQIFDLLTSYEHYVDWTPDVVAATLLAREGDIAVVEFESPELMPGKYQLEFVHARPTSIVFRQKGVYEARGHDSRGLWGQWQLSDVPDGQGVIVSGSMALNLPLWRRSERRRNVEIVLQRRLDVMQHLFTPYPIAPDEALSQSEQQLVNAMVLAADTSPDTALTLWFHSSQYVIQKVNRSNVSG